MSRKEAQEVLLLYRPGFTDPDDEPMQQALELAKGDPELGAWFEQHCQFQRKMAAAFKEIRVPEGFKEQIMSERKSHLSPAKRRVVVLASCASILLAGFVIVSQLNLFRGRDSDTFANLRERMAGEVQRVNYPKMDLVTNSLPAVELYLEKQGHPNISIPQDLARATTTGCAVFPWHGRSVSMICFNSGKTSPADLPDLFLFVLDRSSVESGPANAVPEVKQVKGLFTASWTSGDKVYLLGGFGDEAFLRKYL
jgi:hypothetical protein